MHCQFSPEVIKLGPWHQAPTTLMNVMTVQRESEKPERIGVLAKVVGEGVKSALCDE